MYIDHILESIVLRFDSIEVLPRQTAGPKSVGASRCRSEGVNTPVACYESSEKVVRTQDTDDSEDEEGQSDTVGEERFVVDQVALVSFLEGFPASKGSLVEFPIKGDDMDSPSDETDHGTQQDGEEDLVQPSLQYPLGEGSVDRSVAPSHEEDGEKDERVS